MAPVSYVENHSRERSTANRPCRAEGVGEIAPGMPDQPRHVGLLFIVFGAGASPKRLAGYTSQVVASARTARATNPQLPVALIHDNFARRHLAPEALNGSIFTDLRMVKFANASRLGSPWLKRLHGAPARTWYAFVPIVDPSTHARKCTRLFLAQTPPGCACAHPLASGRLIVHPHASSSHPPTTCTRHHRRAIPPPPPC